MSFEKLTFFTSKSRSFTETSTAGKRNAPTKPQYRSLSKSRCSKSEAKARAPDPEMACCNMEVIKVKVKRKEKYFGEYYSRGECSFAPVSATHRTTGFFRCRN